VSCVHLFIYLFVLFICFYFWLFFCSF
jgi:hypothetical protein